jgi:hypothetical protein
VCNMVRPLLLLQWPQSTIKLATLYANGCLRFISNGRHMTLSTSCISAIVAPAGNQIGDAHP